MKPVAASSRVPQNTVFVKINNDPGILLYAGYSSNITRAILSAAALSCSLTLILARRKQGSCRTPLVCSEVGRILMGKSQHTLTGLTSRHSNALNVVHDI